jgi:ubiquinone/menaquinone biosynthesis C-methylase UbiE
LGLQETEKEQTVDQAMPNWAFRGMSFFFRIRDAVEPRARVLQEVQLEPGFHVLDYGCGPGAYLPDVAAQVTDRGRVYALDLHPLAIQQVRALARRRGLSQIRTIQSDCDTGLPDASIDVVLLYDIFHMLSEPQAVLAELHRVLKPGGTLSVHDPHLDERAIVGGVTQGRLFALQGKGERTYRFKKRQD